MSSPLSRMRKGEMGGKVMVFKLEKGERKGRKIGANWKESILLSYG